MNKVLGLNIHFSLVFDALAAVEAVTLVPVVVKDAFNNSKTDLVFKPADSCVSVSDHEELNAFARF
jgi:hypothetical protein